MNLFLYFLSFLMLLNVLFLGRNVVSQIDEHQKMKVDGVIEEEIRLEREKNNEIVVPLFVNTEYKEEVKIKVFMTTYNPEEVQTDSSPCSGAWKDSRFQGSVCGAYDSGVRPIALSRDLIWGRGETYCKVDCPFRMEDWVKIESKTPQCNFEGYLMDTMNERFTKRGDIFFPDRSMNTSCEAFISNKKS